MIAESIILLSLLGLVFGIFLAIVSKKFEVKRNQKVEEVLSALPGINCGACGYAGCAAYAEAVVANKGVPANLCVPGQKSVADKVASILGRESKEMGAQKVALLHCAGGKKETSDKFEYNGIETCKAASLIANGPKSCSYGCIGFGDCVKACTFGALSMGSNGLPVVGDEKCVACGVCVKTCPKHLFELVPKEKKIHVLCSSNNPGKTVIKVCKVGCIACSLCVKSCKFDAIHVADNLAKIDYSKCTQCGECVKACPRKIIVDERNIHN